MTSQYVHGYSERECERLVDQANTLTELLHADTYYPAGSRVLEAGCGVGAQTITLAAKSPDAHITSIDISETSLAEAQARIEAAGFNNVEFKQANIFALPFDEAEFDHVFLCFVLEHLANPLDALKHVIRVLKPGGTLTLIEGDHGSAYFHPDNAMARRAIKCLVDLQAQAGGNSLIGRELYPLLANSNMRNIHVSPRMVYVDSSRPEIVEGFTRNTFTAMVEGVREAALNANMMTESEWNEGVAALYRTSENDGTFCYTFFKATAQK